jgi:hypothetical protein
MMCHTGASGGYDMQVFIRRKGKWSDFKQWQERRGKGALRPVLTCAKVSLNTSFSKAG